MSNKNDAILIRSIQRHRPAGLSTSGCYIFIDSQHHIFCGVNKLGRHTTAQNTKKRRQNRKNELFADTDATTATHF